MEQVFLELLQAWGCDTESPLQRFLGDQTVYLDYVQEYAYHLHLDTMEQAIERGDAYAAFQQAHTLKGSLGNLGLVPLYEPMCILTELFRRGRCDDYSEPMAQLRDAEMQLLFLLQHASLPSSVR